MNVPSEPVHPPQKELTISAKLKLLAERPHELGGRVSNKVASWIDLLSPPSSIREEYRVSTLPEGLIRLLRDGPLPSYDCELAAIGVHIEQQRGLLLKSAGAFGLFHDGTSTLGELCYLACRYLRPRVVVETGVAHGVTSTYILQALHDNGQGTLFSIDLPPLNTSADKYLGRFVPEHLRARWNLKMGTARRALPTVFSQVQTADLFVHDSLHTHKHMRWELETALSSLRPGGIAIADDIQQNRAFEELLTRPDVEAGFVLQQVGKPAVCGALRKRF